MADGGGGGGLPAAHGREKCYVKFITVLILNICDTYCSNEFVDFRKMKLII